VRIDDEHDLHERLGAAFETISPHPAPIDDAIRGGRVIKRRRRLALAVGVGVVAAAVAVAVPPLVHRTAAPAPASPGQQHYTVTVQAPGRDSTPGVIALGTINGQRWWIIADRPGADTSHLGQQDIVIDGPAVGAPDGSDQYVPPLGTAGSPGPVSFIGITSGPAQVQVGAVQTDVSYVTVRLGNGAVLVLHPVTVYGTRAVAFALPMHATITEVTAYSRHGEIGFAVPFNWPAGGAWVISWLRPGQATAPRVSGVIGSGTAHGKAWSATAYLGPWGTCIALGGGAALGGAGFPSAPALTGVLTLNQGSTPEIAGGVAAASVARIVVTQPDGTKVQVRPVTVGGQKAFAFAVRPGAKSLRWVAYDSAGNVVASSTAAPGG
jgi:hypothetical protein